MTMNTVTKSTVASKSKAVHSAAALEARKGPRGEDLAKMPYEMFCHVYQKPHDNQERTLRAANIGMWAAMTAGTLTMLTFGTWF